MAQKGCFTNDDDDDDDDIIVVDYYITWMDLGACHPFPPASTYANFHKVILQNYWNR
jgi:hypothetical protein